MAEIVNMRGVRKRREREQAGEAAAQNRARFGRTREQVAQEAAALARAARALDGARLELDDQVPAENGAKERDTAS